MKTKTRADISRIVKLRYRAARRQGKPLTWKEARRITLQRIEDLK